MIVIGNWKTCMQSAAITQWLSTYAPLKDVKQAILLPMPYLKWVSDYKKIHEQDWILGVQDVDFFHEVQYVTGAVTCSMLEDCRVEMVLLGHNETRNYKRLENRDIGFRLRRLLESSMTAVLCVGDNTNAWMDCLPDRLEKPLYIAYEPEFSIGSNATVSVDYVEDQLYALDAMIKKRYNQDKSYEQVRWLYGGSVNASNAHALAALEKVEGLLVGRASLVSEDWRKLLGCI